MSNNWRTILLKYVSLYVLSQDNNGATESLTPVTLIVFTTLVLDSLPFAKLSYIVYSKLYVFSSLKVYLPEGQSTPSTLTEYFPSVREEGVFFS